MIVSDFIRYAREAGVPVGPGRGSAAGSLVAYSLGITDLDPIAHGTKIVDFMASIISASDISTGQEPKMVFKFLFFNGSRPFVLF